MNRFTNDSESDKRTQLFFVIYYFVLLIIAMSWDPRTAVLPKMEYRILFIAFFALPLFKYRYLAPAAITSFTTVRWCSVLNNGYLPATPMFYWVLVLLLLFIDIGYKNYTFRGAFSFTKSSKGLIALLMLALLSNAVNLAPEFDFVMLVLTSIMLIKFIRSDEEIQLVEMAFMVVTFCLSIYALVFSSEFVVKEYIGKKVFERSYWVDPNYLGCVIAIGIVISFYYFMHKVKDKVVYRVLYLMVFIAGFVTLGKLASRGAFVATTIPVLYILYKKTKSIKNLVFIIIFVGIAFIAFSSTNYFDTLAQRFASEDGTGSERTVIWETSFNTFIRSDMPTLLLGGGTNYCNVLCGRSLGMAVSSPHNNFFAILYDYGILGLIIFLFVFYSWFNKNSHNVLAISLVLYFGIVCLTLVPMMDYPFCFLLMLFERYKTTSESRVVQWGRSKYPKQDQWRMRRLSSPTSPRSMKAQ